MGGVDRDECIVGVGEQQRRLHDAGQGIGEVAELVHQCALLGEEAAPQRPVIAVRVAPDVPVDVLACGDRPPP
jgi:hypothetical protein